MSTCHATNCVLVFYDDVMFPGCVTPGNECRPVMQPTVSLFSMMMSCFQAALPRATSVDLSCNQLSLIPKNCWCNCLSLFPGCVTPGNECRPVMQPTVSLFSMMMSCFQAALPRATSVDLSCNQLSLIPVSLHFFY